MSRPIPSLSPVAYAEPPLVRKRSYDEAEFFGMELVGIAQKDGRVTLDFGGGYTIEVVGVSEIHCWWPKEH